MGYEVENEFLVRVANGLKIRRFVDVAVFLGEQAQVFIQVCKMNKDGITPVKRERDAAKDISSTYPDVKVEFENYQTNKSEGNKTA